VCLAEVPTDTVQPLKHPETGYAGQWPRATLQLQLQGLDHRQAHARLHRLVDHPSHHREAYYTPIYDQISSWSACRNALDRAVVARRQLRDTRAIEPIRKRPRRRGA
jgi:hypothetical protein